MGVVYATVYNRARSGAWRSEQHGGRWRITEPSVVEAVEKGRRSESRGER